jgi:hypothetical protein
MTKQSMEPVSDIEGLASNYVAKWEELLKWKTIDSAPIEGDAQKKVNIVCLLFPSPEQMKLISQSPEKSLASDMGGFLAKSSAEYLAKDYLAEYVPPNVHVILYPKDEDDSLFPEHSQRAGFHLRHGGYPVALIPLRSGEDGNYRLQPFVVGHELGEIIVSQMHRQEHGQIGIHSDNDHPLKEGFCEILGLDYYKHIVEAQGKEFNLTYDQIYEGSFREHDLASLLSEIPYNELPENDRKFLEYTVSGSMVSALQAKYGIENVVKFFALEANKSVIRDRELKEHMAEIARNSSGIITINLSASPNRSAPNRKDVGGLLKQLGYGVEQFQKISIDSPPIDDKPEGAIATLVADQFASWFPESPTAQRISVMDEVVGDRVRTQSPSFLNTLINRIDGTLGREAFGEEFDFEVFIDQWKDDFISKYQAPDTKATD